MDKRDITRQEVLLDVCDEPIASMDALVERCHRVLSAQLWTTCCWPEGGSRWKIGDFNYLVVSVAPDADTSLYVQFWSEPRECVLLEVGSGERCPGAVQYVGPAQRESLEARGYAVGGGARNYGKKLVIDSPAAAEAAALEVLQIFFEVFGYRGQWQLDVERHHGERADHDTVYTSLTPEDFAKVAARAGCDATVTHSDEEPVVALTRGRHAFLAFMEWRVPGQNLFSLVSLQADVTLKRPVSDEAIARVNAAMRFVKIWRTDDRSVRLRMPLMLDGGVTTAWLAQSLRNVIASRRECERQLRRPAVRVRDQQTEQDAELVH